MPLRVDINGLLRAARAMGAVTVDWKFDRGGADPLKQLIIELQAGKEVALADVEPNVGDLLTYEGQHVLLYIRDQGRNVSKALDDEGEGYKFHVANCTTLKKMRADNRYERYVVTNDVSGQFFVRGVDQFDKAREGHARLFVCRNCLSRLNYRDYRNSRRGGRDSIVHEFALAEFFSVYSSYFDALPSRFSDQGLNAYGPQWDEISRALREKRGWRCEECGVRLAENRRLLHAHHRNGDASDHRDVNLAALCVDCHSKQAGHALLHVSRRDRRLVNHLRRQQGVITPDRSRRRDESTWAKVKALADPACHGLLDMCCAAGGPPPEVGFEFMDDAMVRTQVELAWPGKTAVVVLAKDKDTEWLEQLGWSVYTPMEAMDTWFPQV